MSSAQFLRLFRDITGIALSVETMDGEHWTRFVICRREYRSSFALWVVLLFALGLGLVLLLNGILVYLVNTRDGIIHDLFFEELHHSRFLIRHWRSIYMKLKFI